jgi:asparagine synthetase B (glutamine-hydrolysing)
VIPAAANPFGLTPLEIACGAVFGAETGAEGPPARVEVTGATPLAALEAAILPALLRPPCVVSFSGGRDSSSVLAVATRLARREGLSLPLPATNVFPNAPASDERAWQELVIAYLGLEDWLRIEHDDELDAVGPVAVQVLRRHGLVWPFNAHFHVPLLEAASRGSLLTGIGGDEVFGQGRRSRAALVLGGRARPVARDVLRVGLALSPCRVRTAVLRRRSRPPLTWLTKDARRAAVEAWSSQAAAEPLRPAARLAWWRRLRYVQIGIEAVDRLGAERDVSVHHPLSDLGFLTAMGRAGHATASLDRREAMRRVLGDALPEELYARTTKVHFDEAFWNRHSPAFVDSWNGRGLDADVVDVEALSRLWRSGVAVANTFTLLQAAWIGSDLARSSGADRLEQAASGVTH